MKVAIIGGGVIGLTTAYHLLWDKHEVTVIDAVRPGAGASHGNAGWIVPADAGPVPAPGMVLQALKWMLKRDSPLYVRPSLHPSFLRFMLAMARHCNSRDFRAAYRANLALCEGTLELLDSYAADGVAFEMHDAGLLMAFAEEQGLHEHAANLDIAREFGLDPQVLTGPEVAAREPALRPTLAGGLHFPHERHLRPDLLVSGLLARCRQLGATFLNDAPVTEARRDATVRALVTPRGDIEADAYLLAAGAHSGPLSALFGHRLPVRPGKGYSIDYSPPPVPLTSAVNLCDAKVAVTPLDGRLRLAGTMEFAGLDTVINPVRVAAIRDAPARYFADWHPQRDTASGPWAGARPMTPDGLPIIGRLPGLANAWVATGHGMLGVTLGPGTGRAMAQAIGTGTIPALLTPFDPQRFGARARRTASATRGRGATLATTRRS
jgi:D-amino-acid dehydrogenase